MKRHKLIIKSLHDGQAECKCGRWWYAFTGEVTKKDLQKEYNKHIKLYK